MAVGVLEPRLPRLCKAGMDQRPTKNIFKCHDMHETATFRLRPRSCWGSL